MQGVVLLLLLGLAAATTVSASSLIYKNYIIRYDRGWDILCEPYEVQKDDWVLKLFRQKGEIAHHDFRDFLGIFSRLNPQVKDINLIRPGQVIDIPLRKLEHGSLPGQASGVVTIPFVQLSKVTEPIKSHSEEYQIQRGDTVSQIIARRYGRFGSRSYTEGIRRFQAANPHITDINVIFAGQTVYLPDPAAREQSQADEPPDDGGKTAEIAPQSDPTVVPAASQRPTAPPEQVPEATPLAQAAAIMGGTLFNKGTYFLPRPGQADFELDLSRHPMLDLEPQAKIIFAREERIMDTAAAQIKANWPDLGVVSVSDNDSTGDIVASIFSALQPEENHSPHQGVELGFSDGGVQVTVRAKWTKPESDQRTLCITPINDPGEFTPEPIRRYLEQNGIVIKEILPGGEARTGIQEQPSQRHAVKNILALAPADRKGFVQDLAKALKFSYAPNVKLTFPYAGIQVEAYAHLISAGAGREVLVDYGDLYGDALTAIAQAGPAIVQFKAEEDYSRMATKLLAALGFDFIENPTFWGARRPEEFNTAITVLGILYLKNENEKVLLSAASLHPAVTDLLSTDGVDMIFW